MQSITRRRYKLDRSATKREFKNLRAAEAKYRYELLAEERELKQNLAEFWDDTLDEAGYRGTPFHESEDGR